MLELLITTFMEEETPAIAHLGQFATLDSAVKAKEILDENAATLPQLRGSNNRMIEIAPLNAAGVGMLLEAQDDS